MEMVIKVTNKELEHFWNFVRLELALIDRQILVNKDNFSPQFFYIWI